MFQLGKSLAVAAVGALVAMGEKIDIMADGGRERADTPALSAAELGLKPLTVQAPRSRPNSTAGKSYGMGLRPMTKREIGDMNPIDRMELGALARKGFNVVYATRVPMGRRYHANGQREVARRLGRMEARV